MAKYPKFGNLMIAGFVLKHLKRRVQTTYYAKEMVVDHWFVKNKDQKTSKNSVKGDHILS